MIEFDDRVVRPETLLDVLARDHFTLRFEEHLQDLEWLLLKSNPAAFLAQFAPSKIELKRAEAHI